MSAWLDRLHSRVFQPDTRGEEPAKPSKDPLAGLDGSPPLGYARKTQALEEARIGADEHRRQRVLTMLERNPTTRYAIQVDDPDSDPVVMALAIRDIGTCELAIPRENYDGFDVMRLLNEHAQPESRSPT